MFGKNALMRYRSAFSMSLSFIGVCALMAVATLSAHAATFEAVRSAPMPPSGANDVNGIIVKFSDAARVDPRTASREGRAAEIARAAARSTSRAAPLSYSRQLANGAELHRFDTPRSLTEATAVAASIAQLPGVVYASPNRKMYTQVIPRDVEFPLQWGYRYSAQEQGANFVAAWDVARGSASQTIGIVDGGIAKGHPELSSQLRIHPDFPNGGYDFIRNTTNANDGDGRDNNPEQSANACGHGSHVAGTIAAATHFAGGGSLGVAGGVPDSKLLMARALDFSGDEADVIDAMLWLGGLPVPDIAINPNPVRVMNLSLGGAGACGAAYQDAVDRLKDVGAVVVAAAGNASSDVSTFAPASCVGVVAVAASTVAGDRAGFSNFGAGVTITAPGESIYSTGGATGENCYKSGTSMAAPHVTAAIALAQVASPSLTVSQAILALKAGARAFPSGSNCTPELCGAGLLDARGLIDRASPFAAAAVGWTSGAQSVRENDGSVSLTLARIGSVAASASANVNLIAGTAVAGIDYASPTPIAVSWSAGDASDKTVTIPVSYRSGEQGARRFTAEIVPVSGSLGLVAPSTVPIRITEVDCNSVSPITIGDTVNGDVGVPPNLYCKGGVRGPEYDTVRYRFTANAGDIVTIALNSTASPAVLDPYLYLLDANLRVIAENDDMVAGVQRNALIEQFQILTSGTYYIDATTWSPTIDKSGSYSLSLVSCGPYRAGTTCDLDVDGDGFFDRKDATMSVRRILGMSGDAVNEGMSLRACATRRTGEAVSAFIDSQTTGGLSSSARAFDIDGDGEVSAATDGLMMLRAALRLPGAQIVAGAVSSNATRSTWATIQPYLSNSCGLTLAP